MATYLELYDLTSDADLVHRLVIAVGVAAEKISVEAANVPYHAERIQWAKNVIQNADGVARNILFLALATNRTFTTTQILSASDDALQTIVDNTVNLLI